MLRATSTLSAGTFVSSLNGLMGALSLTSTGGTVLITASGSTINLETNSSSEVISLNGLTGALSLANANGVSWSAAGTTITPSLGNITPTSVISSGNISGATLSGTNVGSPTLADDTTQPLILSGGASPVAANLVGLAIEKSGFEEVFLGINKNTTTGEFGANALYLSTYTATGLWGIGRGNGAGLINTADIRNDSSGNVIIPRAMAVGRTSVTNATLQVDGTWQNVSNTGVMTLNATLPAGGSVSDMNGFIANIATTSGVSTVIKKGFAINLNAGYTGSAGTIAMIASNVVAGTGTDWSGFGSSFPNVGLYCTASAATSGSNLAVVGRAQGSTTGANIAGDFVIDPSVGALSANIAVLGQVRPTVVGSSIGGLFANGQGPSLATSASIIGDAMSVSGIPTLILRGSAMANVTTATVNISGAFTGSSVVQQGIVYSPTYNQTSTAGSTDFIINRTQTGIGSGVHKFIDLEVESVSQASIANNGAAAFGVGGLTSGTLLTVNGNSRFSGRPSVIFNSGTFGGTLAIQNNSGGVNSFTTDISFAISGRNWNIGAGTTTGTSAYTAGNFCFKSSNFTNPFFQIAGGSGNTSVIAPLDATSGANQSSPTLGAQATYWTGSATAFDSWSMQNVMGAGTNPTATLTFAHSGSSGVAAIAIPSPLNSSSPQTTLNGTTAGTIVWSEPFQGTSFKKFIGYANAYENNTITNQTITFTTPFTNPPVITANNTGLTLSVSTTTLTITAPGVITTFSGTIVIEGF